MLKNEDLVEIYLNSGRKKARLFQIVAAQASGGDGSDGEINDIIERWIKRFSRRWSRAGCRSRLTELQSDWLKADFMVSENDF